MDPAPTFYANGRFDPENGAEWAAYLAWANIPGLVEVVGLDSLLCKSPPGLFSGEDGEGADLSLEGDSPIGIRSGPEGLVSRFSSDSRINVLGLYRNPGRHVTTPPAAGFVFLGYELVEEATRVSALTNCGGFPAVFGNEELNRYGLLSGFERAAEVRLRLPEVFPDEPHARCALYAVWRRE